MRIPTIILLFLLISGHAVADDREKIVCGSFQERFLFWLWSSAAPEPDKDRALISPLIEPSEFTAADGQVLSGYLQIIG